MDESSQKSVIDSKIRLPEVVSSEQNTLDLENKCVILMRQNENKLSESDKDQKSENGSDTQYFNAESNGSTSSLKMDGNECQQSDQLDLESQVSLAKINSFFENPLSITNIKRVKPDIHSARDQSDHTKKSLEGVLSTQLELEAIQNIFENVDSQTEISNISIKDLFTARDSTNTTENENKAQPDDEGPDKNKKKKSSAYIKVSIDEVLPNLLNYPTVGVCGDSRKIGKSTLTYEIVSNLLIQRPDKNIIFIDILNGYDAEKQALIFKKHCKNANIKFKNNSALDRVKVLQIYSNKEFHYLMSRLELAVAQVPNACILIIDNLTFFYQDSYGFNFFGRGINRKEFVSHYLKIFQSVAIQTGVTVLFTLPEHLLRENNTNNLIKKSVNEEKIIYEHIKQKIDDKKSSSVNHKNARVKLASNSPGHKSDSEIDNVKPDTHDKLLDKSEIDAGLSVFLSKITQDQYKLKIFKSEKSDNSEEVVEEFYYRIKQDGFELRQKKKIIQESQ